MSDEIKVGSVVQLKSGSRAMTVDQIVGPHVFVVYMVYETNELKSYQLSISSLQLTSVTSDFF